MKSISATQLVADDSDKAHYRHLTKQSTEYTSKFTDLFLLYNSRVTDQQQARRL